MTSIVARVVERHLSAGVLPDPGDDDIVLNTHVTLLNRLISKGETRRLGRIADIMVLDVAFGGTRVSAEVQGATGRYNTSINFQPPGHRCTCPDWQRNGALVGPCKHVLRLADLWLDHIITKMER